MRDHALTALELFSKGDLDALFDHIGSVVYTEFATGRSIKDDEYREALAGWRLAFPDMVGDVKAVVDDGDSVAIEIVWKGTHDGPMHTPDGEIPPTGNALEVPASIIYQYENGALVRTNHYFDLLTVLRAVGAA